MSFQDKVIVITGAGRGIGRAAALKFAANGAKIALVARTDEQLIEAEKEIKMSGGIAVSIPTDITNEFEVENGFSKIKSVLGPVDILINNAGAMILKSIAETTVEEWNSVMNTNVLGAFMCSRAVFPSMIERQLGRIINVGSMAGRRGYPEQGAYCASKHALYGLSKVMALEGQPYGIRVQVVSPGGVLTGFSEELLASRGASEAAKWMSAEEVADAIYYAASQDGPAFTDELVLRRFESEPWR